MLAIAGQILTPLEDAQAQEDDPVQLDRLYRVDHGLARIRRQAENLKVLAGATVEDAGRQVTSLLDVVRAATSTIEHYPRIQVGRIAELAVVEYAADDVIRIVTELLDNAIRYAPPPATAVVAAHLTNSGHVMMRIEDTGYGSKLLPDVAGVNAMLAGHVQPNLSGTGASHLGLIVVRTLALAHRIRVQLASRQGGGTTAMVHIPARLLCEIPGPSTTAGAAATAQAAAAAARPAARPTARPTAVAATGPGTGIRDGNTNAASTQPDGRAGIGSRRTASGLPLRKPASTRIGPAAPPPANTPGTQRRRRAQEIADFEQAVTYHHPTSTPTTEGPRG